MASTFGPLSPVGPLASLASLKTSETPPVTSTSTSTTTTTPVRKTKKIPPPRLTRNPFKILRTDNTVAGAGAAAAAAAAAAAIATATAPRARTPPRAVLNTGGDETDAYDEDDNPERKWNQEFQLRDQALLEMNQFFMLSLEDPKQCNQYYNLSQYVVRFELNRDKLLEIGKTIHDVVAKIKRLLEGKHMWIVSPVFAKEWVIRIRLNKKAVEYSKRNQDRRTIPRTEKQTVQCLIDILLIKQIFHGLNGIREVYVHKAKKLHWDSESLEMKTKEEYHLITRGNQLARDIESSRCRSSQDNLERYS